MVKLGGPPSARPEQMQDDSSVRQRQAQGLSAAAVLLCTVAFAVISVCSYGVFGKKTSPDVLNNYSLKALEKLLWTPLAEGGAWLSGPEALSLSGPVALSLSGPEALSRAIPGCMALEWAGPGGTRAAARRLAWEHAGMPCR